MIFPQFSATMKFHPLAHSLLLWVSVIALGLSIGSCAHWRDSYLKKSVDEATQEDIEAKLGKPWRKKTSLLNGQSTWIYRYALTKAELDPMGVNTLGRSVSQATNTAASLIGKGDPNLVGDKPRCFHYILTFDKSKILKNWLREDCASTSL